MIIVSLGPTFLERTTTERQVSGEGLAGTAVPERMFGQQPLASVFPAAAVDCCACRTAH